jgi:Tfp pilus assembly protein PilN
MIKVNLLVGKKPLDITNIGGFDLSKLNLKHLVVAIIIFYIPDLFIYDMFKDDLSKRHSEIVILSKEMKTINKKVKSLKNIQKQIKALEVLDKQLHDKLGVVKDIIKLKTNPMNILMYISRNIPKELWLKEIIIDNNILTLKGESKSSKSIGDFMDNLKKSIFFRKDVKLPSFKTVSINDIRIEKFEIVATIVSYE